MNRSPSPPRAQGGGSWEALAAKMKGFRNNNSANQSVDGSDRKPSEYGSNVSIENLDTSDMRQFPPPVQDDRAKQRHRERRRDEVTGWVFRGSNKDGGQAINILRGDATMIDLAVAGKTTLEAQLKMQTKPVIGLDEIIEYIDPEADSAPRVYSCIMCGIMRTVAHIMDHVLSYNHKVRAIRKRFPNEVKSYLLPDGKTINRSQPLMGVATRRAAEIELVYGRGEVQVRHERPSYPEDALDAEESEQLIMTSSKSLESLKQGHDFFKKYKIESQEEFRLVKAIMDLLQDSLIEWRVNQSAAAQ